MESHVDPQGWEFGNCVENQITVKAEGKADVSKEVEVKYTIERKRS